MYAVDARDWQYDHCYAYDSIPFGGTISSEGSSVTASQNFTVSGGEVISAVGVETGTAELTVTATVSCGGQTASQTIYTTYPGYYLIPLDETVTAEQVTPVTVSVTFEGGGGSIKVPVEVSNSDYGGVNFTAYCGGGGVVINGGTRDYDGRIKLFTLNGVGTAPTITKQPQSQTEAKVGETVRFTVGAKGTKLQYQWQKLVKGNWTDVPDGNKAVLTIEISEPVTAEKYSCLITNDWGNVRSQTVELTATYRSEPDLVLPAALTEIGEEAFAGGAFKYVKLSENTVTIGPRAFKNCPNLRYVELENPDTYIDPTAFQGVSAVTVIGASAETAAAFAGVSGVSFAPAA